MKNLQIGDNDLIGNKFNGHDLHFYLKDKGWNSFHLTANKQSDDENTFIIPTIADLKLKYELYQEHESYYAIHGMLYPFVYDIIYNKLFLETDIVHYHLIHNYFFNIHLLPIMTKLKPSVWTLHDPWALSGHCIHSFDCEKWKTGCGDCTYLDTHFAMSPDNTAFNFELKRQAIQNSDISVIVASKWMKQKVEQSPIFKNKPIYHVPFGINQNLYKPEDKETSKKEFGIKQDSLVLMFRSVLDPFKGLDIIKNSLKTIETDKDITLITVGEKGLLDEFKEKFKILEYGWINDDKKLVKLYQASDLFLMPSKQETFGLMAIEAMSCGKMVLSIEGTSLPDVINATECGIAASRNADEYAKELQRLIDNPSEIEQRGLKSLEYARQNYNHEVYVERIINVYKEVIANHKLDDESKHVLEQLKKHMIGFNANKVQQLTEQPKSLMEKFAYSLYRPILKMICGKERVKSYYDKILK